MHNRKHGLIFRVFIRRKIGRLPVDQRAKVKQVLDDDDLCEACTEEVQEMYGRESGSIMDFLTWLLENADAIIAMIVKIIDMFSSQEPVNA